MTYLRASHPRLPGHVPPRHAVSPLVLAPSPLILARIKRDLLRALAAGPLPLRKLAGPLALAPGHVREVLNELLIARAVKRLGRHRHARWALLAWTGPVIAYASPFSRTLSADDMKPFIAPKPRPPAVSWWIGVTRAAWSATVEAHDIDRRNGAPPERAFGVAE